MQLVTFGTDRDKNLIVPFPIFVQPYTQQSRILYQLEIRAVNAMDNKANIPSLDQNDRVHSYTHLQVEKPYIVLNSETYISLRQQELGACKRIGYEFYCKELFVVKHKTRYSCESAIYFKKVIGIIKENSNFRFYYNKRHHSHCISWWKGNHSS